MLQSLSPQVSKSSAPPPAFEDNSPEYSPVDIFSTEDFFPKQESSNSGGSTS